MRKSLVLLILVTYFMNKAQCSGGHKKASLESARIAAAYNLRLKRQAGPKPVPGPGPRPLQITTTTTTKKILFCPFKPNLKCDTSSKYQTFDGTCNNLNNPLYGAWNTPYKRFLTPAYQDGSNSPRSLSTTGAALPNPRKVSRSILNDQNNTETSWYQFFASFGQFMVHDITSLAASSGN